ncbi:organic cation transporter protein [Nephila pilipes]|uniref:Organic cation transporter protein n=1 Tax=Nephila pilipes TaxID=299642 RepID=A0A8X6QG54_NEPPI|nr:organic cation transporter protein [Nephila pilipes]
MWQNFSIVFLAPNMDFHCVLPSTGQHVANESVLPFDDRCEVPQEGNSSFLVPCTEWEYDTSHTSETIVSEWDLVCSREWLISLAKSIYMIGFLLSVFTFGQISDLVGRFPTIVTCYCITCVSMFLSLLSNSFGMFLVLRFFHAFGRAGATTVGYVLNIFCIQSQQDGECFFCTTHFPTTQRLAVATPPILHHGPHEFPSTLWSLGHQAGGRRPTFVSLMFGGPLALPFYPCLQSWQQWCPQRLNRRWASLIQVGGRLDLLLTYNGLGSSGTGSGSNSSYPLVPLLSLWFLKETMDFPSDITSSHNKYQF